MVWKMNAWALLLCFILQLCTQWEAWSNVGAYQLAVMLRWGGRWRYSWSLSMLRTSHSLMDWSLALEMK